MSLTTAGKIFSLKKLFGQSVAARTTNYLGLGFGTDADGITNEVNVTGYARVEVLPASWGLLGDDLINTTKVNLATTSASFGSPTSWGIFDALTGGNCLFAGVINPTQEIGASQQVYFPIGELNLSLSDIASGDGFTDYWKKLMLTDLVGKTNTTAPTMMVGLSANANLATIIDQETFTGGYARTAFGSSKAVTVATGKANTDNLADISFTVTGTWGSNLIRMFIADHATGAAEANLIFSGPVMSISPVLGDIVKVLIGDFKITLE